MNSAGTYTFFISDTTLTARFLLHISASHVTESFAAQCNSYNDGKAIAIAKGIGPWNYAWVNASNSVLKLKANTFFSDTLKNIPAGDYSVHITQVNGVCGTSVQKITVTEPAPVYAGFSFSADTIFSGGSDSLVLQNTSSYFGHDINRNNNTVEGVFEGKVL